MHSKNTPSRGFSLIEMAIIAMVIGVIVATVLPAMLSKMQRDVTKRGKRDLTAMRDEVLGYAAINGNLPALSSLSIQNDVWGNPFSYIVAKKTSGAVLGDSLDGLVNINDVESTNLSVVDGSTGTTLAQNVAFVLTSRGPNSELQISESGAGTLNHVVTVYPNGYSDGTITTPFDDITEYAILSYAKGKAAASAGAAASPAGSDVSFSQDVASFDETSVANPPGVGTNITINTEDGTIDLGNNIGGSNLRGCIWYQGDSAGGNCASGKCEFGYGFRAYFSFVHNRPDTSVNSADVASGFTFAFIDADSNDSDVCGASNAASSLGYAGGNVLPPKWAVEFDGYSNPGVGSKNDPTSSYNHAAIVWFASAGAARSGWVSNVDDNAHNHYYTDLVGARNAVPGDTSPNANAVAWDTSKVTWLEDGNSHTVRVEVYRNATAGSDPNGEAVVKTTVWIDCNTTCSDLTTPYAGTAYRTLSQRITLLNNATALSGGMQHFRFGWTQATASTNPADRAQDITLSDFGIKFLTTEPNHSF